MTVIIKRGNLPEEKVIETTCGNCQTVFTFKPKEASLTGDQRDGDFYSIDCPVCYKTCYVSANKGTR